MSLIREDDSPSVAGVILLIGAILFGATLIQECGKVRAEVESYTISMGQLTAAEHELDANGVGHFAVGVNPDRAVSLAAPVESIPWLRLRALRGRQVEIIVRVTE